MLVLNNLQAIGNGLIETSLILNVPPFEAKTLGDFDRIDASQNNTGIITALPHLWRTLPKGIGDNAVSAIVGNNVEQGDTMMHSRPNP